MVEDFDVDGLEDLFFLCTLLRVLRQSISSSISFALSIINLDVITREFLSLADFFGAQTLCVYEMAEVIMIDKYKHLMLRAF